MLERGFHKIEDINFPSMAKGDLNQDKKTGALASCGLTYTAYAAGASELQLAASTARALMPVIPQ